MTETVNLGDLFKQKIKQQPVQPSKHAIKQREKNEKKYRRSGIYRVAKVYNTAYKQGYFYSFTYIDEKGARRTLSSTKLIDLYKKCLNRGDNFIVTNAQKARAFIDENTDNDEDFRFIFDNVIMGKKI